MINKISPYMISEAKGRWNKPYHIYVEPTFLHHLSMTTWRTWFHLFQILFLNENINFNYLEITLNFFEKISLGYLTYF